MDSLEGFVNWRVHGRAHCQNKRADRNRLKGRLIVGTITLEDMWIFFFMYDHCLACGSTGPLTVDHVIPLSKGGANTLKNLQPLCEACNQAKGTRKVDYRGGFLDG